jgi:hypothetical protein
MDKQLDKQVLVLGKIKGEHRSATANIDANRGGKDREPFAIHSNNSSTDGCGCFCWSEIRLHNPTNH